MQILHIALLVGSLISLILTFFICRYLYIKTEILKIKPPIPSPIVPPHLIIPEVMKYGETFAHLNRFIVAAFQRTYTNSVIPEIMDAKIQVAQAVPNDKTYNESIIKIVIKIVVEMPWYLKKSALYYFNATEDNPSSAEYINFTNFIATKVKGLLDSQLIDNVKAIEIEGNPYNTKMYVKNIKTAGKIAQGKKQSIEV